MMAAPQGLVHADGQLTDAAVQLLHLVAEVPAEQLREARVRAARTNWLHAPWYPYHRGGGLTIGRTIWLTRKFHAPDGWGNDRPASVLRWVLLLAHEVGHLPQAARIGPGLLARMRYVALFAGTYALRALLFRWPVHDGARLEIEADRGRAVLLALLRGEPVEDPLVLALARMDAATVHTWCVEHRETARSANRRYDALLR